MVVVSTILHGRCYIVDMTTKQQVYEIPNLGCLLGMAYQAELTGLSNALTNAGINITAAEYLIIRILFTRERMQQCEISRLLRKDRASITRSIKSLEKKGYVVADAVSYKCCLVSLTESGRALEQSVMKIADEQQQKLQGKLTQQEIDSLRQILIKII